MTNGGIKKLRDRFIFPFFSKDRNVYKKFYQSWRMNEISGHDSVGKENN